MAKTNIEQWQEARAVWRKVNVTLDWLEMLFNSR